MTQKPAYTAADIIAAGMAMRARGIEPERPSLWGELGRRGLASTAWNTWLQHRDEQLPARVGISLNDEVQSPDMTRAIEGQQRALATIIACAKAEAMAPLLSRIEQLERALTREIAERKSLERLTEDLEAELAKRDAVIAAAQQGAGTARLILPGRP